MDETTQQYTDRILSYTQGQDSLSVQEATIDTLTRLVSGASVSKLRERPTPEQWSVTEILAHLADAEIVYGWRIRAILGAPGGRIEAYDQNAWSAAGHYSTRDPNDSLELLCALRKANLALLCSLTPEQWKFYGIHAERGQESLERLAEMYSGHDLNHLRQIERILSSSGEKAA
jgi:hypothetical protein